MVLFPNAKINLGLHVLHKRMDGFHEIKSVMVPVPIFDVLEILPAKEFTFFQSGIAVDGDTEHNLCVRAYRMMEANYQIEPVYMHLRKQIPMGAGLGGGSSDAAFVITGINELFKLKLSIDEMKALAAQLGSDCPFFISNKPQIASGRGEILDEIQVDLSSYYLKLVNPGVHVGTREAYAGINFQHHEFDVASLVRRPIEEWKEFLVNDFESSVFELYPNLRAIKQQLYAEGAVYAAMSGSGSTLFGIYRSMPPKSFAAQNYLEVVNRF